MNEQEKQIWESFIRGKHAIENIEKNKPAKSIVGDLFYPGLTVENAIRHAIRLGKDEGLKQGHANAQKEVLEIIKKLPRWRINIFHRIKRDAFGKEQLLASWQETENEAKKEVKEYLKQEGIKRKEVVIIIWKEKELHIDFNELKEKLSQSGRGEKMTIKQEIIIEESFRGQIEYSNNGMRHSDEIEKFFLEKGDKVIIIRKPSQKCPKEKVK